MSRSDYKSLSKGYLDNTRSHISSNLLKNVMENKSVENFDFDTNYDFFGALYEPHNPTKPLPNEPFRAVIRSSDGIYRNLISIVIVGYVANTKNYKIKLRYKSNNSVDKNIQWYFVGTDLTKVDNRIILTDDAKIYEIPYSSIVIPETSPKIFGSLLTNSVDKFVNVNLDPRFLNALRISMKKNNECSSSIKVYISNFPIGTSGDYDYVNKQYYDSFVTIEGEHFKIKTEDSQKFYIEIACEECCKYVDNRFDTRTNKIIQKYVLNTPTPSGCNNTTCRPNIERNRDIVKDTDCNIKDPILVPKCKKINGAMNFTLEENVNVAYPGMRTVCGVNSEKRYIILSNTDPRFKSEQDKCKNSLGL